MNILTILVSFRRRKLQKLTFTKKSVSFDCCLKSTDTVTHKIQAQSSFMLTTSCSTVRRTSNILECGFFFGCSFIGCGIGWRIISWLILGWRQVVLVSSSLHKILLKLGALSSAQHKAGPAQQQLNFSRELEREQNDTIQCEI